MFSVLLDGKAIRRIDMVLERKKDAERRVQRGSSPSIIYHRRTHNFPRVSAKRIRRLRDHFFYLNAQTATDHLSWCQVTHVVLVLLLKGAYSEPSRQKSCQRPFGTVAGREKAWSGHYRGLLATRCCRRTVLFSPQKFASWLTPKKDFWFRWEKK